MDSLLATEATDSATTVATVEKPGTLAPLETWTANERMRHVPSAEWMARKLDGDLRKRIEISLTSFSNIVAGDPRRDSAENEFRALCKSIEKLCDAAKNKHHNGNNHHGDVASRIETALANAVAALRALEPTAFGRRNPYHYFDRSKAEPVYAGLLAVIYHIEKTVTLVRTIDPDIDARLLGTPIP